MKVDSDPRSPQRLLGPLTLSAFVVLLATSCGDDDKSTKPNPYPDRVPTKARRVDDSMLRFLVSNTGAPQADVEESSGGRLALINDGSGSRETSVLYDAGLWIGANVNGQPRASVTSFYSGDFLPEQLTASEPVLTYVLYPGDHEEIPDYAQWPVALGAPATPEGHPRRIGSMTTWTCYQDRDASAHRILHSTPLGAVIRETNWVQPWTPTVLFTRYQIHNGSNETWSDARFGLWTDADLTDPLKNRVGCDLARDMAYAYPDTTHPESPGSSLTAAGVLLLVTPGNTGLTAFPKQYKNVNEPTDAAGAFNLLHGVDLNGSAFIDPTTNQPTLFWASGDPVTGEGFIDPIAMDRRMLTVTGPITLGPGESTELIIAYAVATGSDKRTVILNLRSLADQVRRTPELWSVE